MSPLSLCNSQFLLYVYIHSWIISREWNCLAIAWIFMENKRSPILIQRYTHLDSRNNNLIISQQILLEIISNELPSVLCKKNWTINYLKMTCFLLRVQVSSQDNKVWGMYIYLSGYSFTKNIFLNIRNTLKTIPYSTS